MKLTASTCVVLGLVGCGDGTGTVRVALLVKGPAMGGLTADACANEIESAQLVMRELELERVEDNGDPDDVETGPFVIDIASADFNGVLREAVLTAELPVGSYDEVEFDIHKLDDGDAADQAAAAADPILADMLAAQLSVRITGVRAPAFGGGNLLFTSSLNEEQKRPVAIEVGDSVSGVDGITLSIDPAGWFRDKQSGDCLDPNDPANRSRIEESIKASIDVDEDDDHDGRDDAT